MSKSRVAWRTLNLAPKPSQASVRNTKSAPIQRVANSQGDLDSKPKFPVEHACKCSKMLLLTLLLNRLFFLAIQHIPIKTINICSAADLKYMRQKKEANKKIKILPAKKPMTFHKLLRKLITFGLKIVVVGNIFYLMCDAGVWGDSERAQEFANWMFKLQSDEDEEDEQELEGGVSFSAVHYYHYMRWGFSIIQIVVSSSEKGRDKDKRIE